MQSRPRALYFGSSGASPKRGWKGRCKTGPRPTGTGSWTTGAKAHLIALACSEPPEGHEHWTLRLLAGKVVELGLAPSLSHETVRLHLKKNALKPWQKQEWCIPKSAPSS